MGHFEIRRDEAAHIIRRNRGQADRLAKELEEFAIAILDYDRKVRHAHPDHQPTHRG